MKTRRVLIEPVHDDNSVCDHEVTTKGRPKDPDSDCTGRTGYQARCTEHGVLSRKYLRLLVEPDAKAHRQAHRDNTSH